MYCLWKDAEPHIWWQKSKLKLPQDVIFHLADWQKFQKADTLWVKLWRNRYFYTLLFGVWIGTTPMAGTLAYKRIPNACSLWSSNFIFELMLQICMWKITNVLSCPLQDWKQLICSSIGNWLNKHMRSICVKEYCATVKKNEESLSTFIQKALQSILLSGWEGKQGTICTVCFCGKMELAI